MPQCKFVSICCPVACQPREQPQATNDTAWFFSVQCLVRPCFIFLITISNCSHGTSGVYSHGDLTVRQQRYQVFEVTPFLWTKLYVHTVQYFVRPCFIPLITISNCPYETFGVRSQRVLAVRQQRYQAFEVTPYFWTKLHTVQYLVRPWFILLITISNCSHETFDVCSQRNVAVRQQRYQVFEVTLTFS